MVSSSISRLRFIRVSFSLETEAVLPTETSCSFSTQKTIGKGQNITCQHKSSNAIKILRLLYYTCNYVQLKIS